jgi:hypothetical protein
MVGDSLRTVVNSRELRRVFIDVTFLKQYGTAVSRYKYSCI